MCVEIPAKPLWVLILEDDLAFAAAMESAVQSLGWKSVRCARIVDAISIVSARSFDLILLDRMLDEDGSDGLQLMAELNRLEITPGVMVVSALDSPGQRVEGLRYGADDYLCKPFDTDELAARLVALARRTGRRAPYATVRVVGDLEIRLAARTVRWRGRHVPVSGKPFAMLALLAETPGLFVPRTLLWKEVWPDFPNLPPQDNVIEATMKRLRQSLAEVMGSAPITTVRGRGYRLDVR